MPISNILIAAIMYSVLMSMISYGFYPMIGLYGIMGLMIYNTCMVVVASSASVFGFVNPKENIEEMKKEGSLNSNTKLLTFFLQVIQGTAIYSLYVAGFAFASGVFATSLGVMFLGNIFRAIKGVK